jgi:hypothetical protein
MRVYLEMVRTGLAEIELCRGLTQKGLSCGRTLTLLEGARVL